MTEDAQHDTRPEKESLIARLRRRYAWLDHLVRANESFGEHYGNHYAAAVTYFSVLSLVPILMVAFSALGLVVHGNKSALDQISSGIMKSVPAGLADIVNSIITHAATAGSGLGIVGLLLALYSGIGWMSNLRDALTAQWGQEKKSLPLIKTTLQDLVALVGLGLALLVSFGLTAVGSGAGRSLLKLVGLQDQSWARFLLTLATIVLGLIANFLVFLWVIARLPREPVSTRSAVKGAIVAAVGFLVLQQIGSIYLSSVTKSPSFSALGPILGLLVFANLVAQFLLYITAWTATAPENIKPAPPSPPEPAIIRPTVQVRRGPDRGQAMSLLGIGAAAAVLLRAGRRRR